MTQNYQTLDEIFDTLRKEKEERDRLRAVMAYEEYLVAKALCGFKSKHVIDREQSPEYMRRLKPRRPRARRRRRKPNQYRVGSLMVTEVPRPYKNSKR